MRRGLTGLFLVFVVVVGGCSGGEMSLTEYVERLDVIMERALEQGEVLVASPPGAVLVTEGSSITEFTPQDLQAALDRAGEIEVEMLAAADAIEPPAEVADLHALWFNTRYTAAREALATRAGTAADWEELSETPEMIAYRIALAGDKRVCADFQAELEATEQQGVFVDTPWIPSKLKEVAEAGLGCGFWPEHPEDMYRPPPTSTP